MNLEMLKSTVDLQNELNNYTCGSEWSLGKTSKGRDIDWFRCIYVESVEAISSTNYKHWKSLETPDDIENIKMELVDIYHFLLSVLIKHKGTEATKSYLELYLTPENTDDKYDGLEKLMLISLERNSNAIGLLKAFSIALGNWGMSIDDLVSLYVIKNVLNTFRQDNGYKEGTYIKNWSLNVMDVEDFIEDNAVVKRLSEKAKTADELYGLMNNHYNLVKTLKRG